MQKSGFTLMEMVIVVAILAAIVGIVFLAISNPLERGEGGVTRAHALQVETLIEQYRRLYSLNSQEIAESIAKESGYTLGEKIAGSLPYLIDIRRQESGGKDFCASPSGTAYKFLKTLNNNSDNLLHSLADTTPTLAVRSEAQADGTTNTTKILCKSLTSGNEFGIAAEVKEGVWVCGGYAADSGQPSKYRAPRYFNQAANPINKSFNMNCLTTDSTLFESASEEYNG